MKIYCQVTSEGLVPMYDSDYSEKKKLKVGDRVLCEIKKPRNYEFHKKFFALLRLTFDNLPDCIADALGIYCEDDLLVALKLDIGYAEVATVAGHDIIRTKSISFPAMDNTEFEHFYNNCVSVILGKYLRGTNRQDLLDEINRFR